MFCHFQWVVSFNLCILSERQHVKGFISAYVSVHFIIVTSPLPAAQNMRMRSRRVNRSVNVVIVNKQSRNIMLHCHQLSSPLLSPGSVPDSVGRAAIQSESRLFLWTAAFALTKQNATHWLMLCSHSCFKGTQKTSLKEFGLVFYIFVSSAADKNTLM